VEVKIKTLSDMANAMCDTGTGAVPCTFLFTKAMERIIAAKPDRIITVDKAVSNGIVRYIYLPTAEPLVWVIMPEMIEEVIKE